MDRLGLCGFKNFGNTCWLNSSIQCLLKTEPMINYFLSKNFNNTILSKEWARLIHGTIDDDCIITPLSF